MGQSPYSLSGATIVTPTDIHRNTTVTLSDGYIETLGQAPAPRTWALDDCLIFPGLINAHDHLNGTWWPRVGPGRPYPNVYAWLDDFEQSAVVHERRKNAIADIYELGIYRNMISGVTTVADHFYRLDRPDFYTRFPIDVLHKYGRTWTPREPTAWGEDIPTEYQLAVRSAQPYIIHLAEGVDAETSTEMDVLTRANALGRNTMIIHGISLRPQDMEAMAQVGATVCWCPGSNRFLYGQTADIRALEEAGVNVTLGTDSTLTGGLNVLDEVRIARQAFREQTTEDPPARWLVELLTTRAAQALLLQDRRGQIAPGYRADLLVLPDSKPDPYTALVEAEMNDITLLIRAGVPVYGDAAYRPLFEQLSPGFSSIWLRTNKQSTFREKLIAGDPPGLIARLSQTVGHEVHFPFLPIDTSSEENTRS